MRNIYSIGFKDLYKTILAVELFQRNIRLLSVSGRWYSHHVISCSNVAPNLYLQAAGIFAIQKNVPQKVFLCVHRIKSTTPRSVASKSWRFQLPFLYL